MLTLSPWIELTNTFGGVEYISGATRFRIDGNIHKIEDRYAFIEKTPRVRIRSGRDEQWQDFLNWAEGFKGDGPTDQESRKWCDDMLTLLGYKLT